MRALQRVIVVFDLAEMSDALRLPGALIEQAFRDGRGAWPFTEMWGERLFEYVMHGNSNEAFSDGAVDLPNLGNIRVSVKALTRAGIKFQQSKFVGSGRSGGTSDLVASLEACDRVVVVDIRAFPRVAFYPLTTGPLISAAHAGRLTTAGWTGPRFDDWLRGTHDVSDAIVDLTAAL